MHRTPEVLAAKNFVSHTAIMPGTPPGHGAPRRDFFTQGGALPLLNLVASPALDTSSEPLHSPPPPSQAAHAAHKSQMTLIGIPRDCQVVAMITWGQVTSTLQPRNAEGPK
jgi:hypothetical protein